MYKNSNIWQRSVQKYQRACYYKDKNLSENKIADDLQCIANIPSTRQFKKTPCGAFNFFNEVLKAKPMQSDRYYCDHDASNVFPVNNQEPFINTPPPSLLKICDVRKENITDWAVLDSGATSHCLIIDATATKVTHANNPVTFTIPDGSTLKSTHRELDLPQLPMAARIGHVIPGLASRSLMSVVQLTYAGCGVHFLKHYVTVTYRGRVVLEGAKDINNKIWMA